MEVNKIKKENNEKIKQNEILLEEVQDKINELYLEEHKMCTRYNKNQKEYRKMKKIVNIGCTSVVVCLTIPVFIQSAITGLSVSLIYGGWLVISNKALNKMHKQDNENDKCSDSYQTNISKEICENEMFKNKIENSLFVRNIINAILNNNYVALSELQTVSTVFNDYDILHDFNKNEYNVLNNYINNKSQEELTFNNYSNQMTKEKVKIKK